MDRSTVKRMLRYVRQRKTVLHKKYVMIIGKGKTKAAQEIKGQVISYNEMAAYLERLLRDIPESVEMDNGELANWPSYQ